MFEFISKLIFLQLCDISLRVGVTTLSAHRVVLAAASPYFHAMFNGKCMNISKPLNKFFIAKYIQVGMIYTRLPCSNLESLFSHSFVLVFSLLT